MQDIDYFIFYQPRDVVSGDFYWIHKVEGKVIVIAADCTGHGVPGAFMTMVGTEMLNDIILKDKIIEPHHILNLLQSKVRKTLRQDETNNRDGMDLSILVIDYTKKEFEFAGAKSSVFVVSQNQETSELKGDRISIGGDDEEIKDFSKQTHQWSMPSTVYLYSDGYYDQIGGEKNKKFLSGKFKELLKSFEGLTMSEKEEALRNIMINWISTGKEKKQFDDILVMGIELP